MKQGTGNPLSDTRPRSIINWHPISWRGSHINAYALFGSPLNLVSSYVISFVSVFSAESRFIIGDPYAPASRQQTRKIAKTLTEYFPSFAINRVYSRGITRKNMERRSPPPHPLLWWGGGATIEVLKRKSLTAASDTNKLRLLCGERVRTIKWSMSGAKDIIDRWAGRDEWATEPKERTSKWIPLSLTGLGSSRSTSDEEPKSHAI